MRLFGLTICVLFATTLAAGNQLAFAKLRVPAGVHVSTVANVKQPTNIAFDEQKRLWISSGGNTTSSSDGVWFVPSAGAKPRHVIKRLFTVLGLTWFKQRLYVGYVSPYNDNIRKHVGRVAVYSNFNGRRFLRHRVILKNLPVGVHTVDSILPGPGNRLYLGIGSLFDHNPSNNRLSGTVVSFTRNGKNLRVEARGLRNPYGLDFIPGTGTLLVTDNGRDDLGLYSPPDELNLIPSSGRTPFFGFPNCYNQGGAVCNGVRPPLISFAPHASADGIAIAKSWGNFGTSAFVAQNGSSFKGNPTGDSVVRVSLRKSKGVWIGKKHTFAKGFSPYDPLGAAIGPQNALFVTLWTSGRVVRFTP